MHECHNHDFRFETGINEAIRKTAQSISAHALAEQLPGVRKFFDMRKAVPNVRGELGTEARQ